MTDNKEASVKVLSQIYAAFGFDEPINPDASVLLPLIADGSLLFDSATESCEYRLKAPLTLKNDKRLEVVKFREACGLELEYIRQGIQVGTDQKIDLGNITSMVLRVLIKTGDLATGVADRIKARDVDTLKDVFLELGFFAR